MIFRVRQIPEHIWAIAPDSGRFEGITVARAEGVSMRSVVFNYRVAVGRIKAVWGAEISVPEVFSDPCTLRDLGLGKALDPLPSDRLTLDYDGFLDSNNTPCKGASRLLLIGANVYAKGVM